MTRICAPIVELEGAYSSVISSFPKAVAMSIALMAASPMKVVVGVRGSRRMARATPPNDAHGSNDVLSSTIEIEVKSFGDAESFFEGADGHYPTNAVSNNSNAASNCACGIVSGYRNRITLP